MHSDLMYQVVCFLLTNHNALFQHSYQCDQKKWPNVYKSCPKMISLERYVRKGGLVVTNAFFRLQYCHYEIFKRQPWPV